LADFDTVSYTDQKLNYMGLRRGEGRGRKGGRRGRKSATSCNVGRSGKMPPEK